MLEGCKRGAKGVQSQITQKKHAKRAKWKGVVDNREQAIQNKANKNIQYRAKGRGVQTGCKGCKRVQKGCNPTRRFECERVFFLSSCRPRPPAQSGRSTAPPSWPGPSSASGCPGPPRPWRCGPWAASSGFAGHGLRGGRRGLQVQAPRPRVLGKSAAEGRTTGVKPHRKERRDGGRATSAPRGS